MSTTHFNIPKKLMEQLVEDNGNNPALWPQELRDLIDPTIEARAIAPPLSGRIEKILNTDYHYHWAFDRCGATPDHDRVESLRYAGWEFATTEDVQMCAESTIIGADRNKKSRGSRIGFSDEIRSGDRRLMKLKMELWRALRKSQNLQAYQYTMPRAFGEKGEPMTAGKLIPGLATRELVGTEIDEAHRQAVQQNPGREKSKGE